MSDAALREDVVAALGEAKGVTVTEMADGSYEIAAVGQMVRRFALKPTVPRRLLWQFERWYSVPIAAFFKSYRTKPETNAASE